MLSILFPSKCPVCGKIIKEEGRGPCRTCERKLPVICGARCVKCGKPVAEEGGICGDCAKRKFSYERGYALWLYNSVTKKIIAEMKYGGRRDYSGWLAAELAYHMYDFIRSVSPDAIVPVPLHSARYRQRGFNQAEIIARGVSEKTGIRLMADVLARTKKTLPQKKLDDTQREKNLSDAFTLDMDNMEKYGNVKKVLLIDDIYTTGSTIDACASVLKKEGVESYFAALCIGQGF